jgi:tetratricopeptide (TPR) repeat protein
VVTRIKLLFSRYGYRALAAALFAVALVYAGIAGFRTVADGDLGWQLATGRYVWSHHAIPRAEVFSYTAQGREWIYPPYSGLLLYVIYRLGGYVVLSLLGAAACVVSVFAIARKGSVATAIAAALAVPLIAMRTAPRAELFTTVLFATLAAMLWHYYRGGNLRLWLIPIVMFAWVNLHPGFIAGLALLIAYLALELATGVFAWERPLVLVRLTWAVPWIITSFALTLLNPWAWRMYVALYHQQQGVRQMGDVAGEWSHPLLTPQAIWDSIVLHRPEASLYFLLLFAGLAIVFASRRRKYGHAAVLIVAVVAGVLFIRVQALFAIVVVVFGGGVLDDLFAPSSEPQPDLTAEPQPSRSVLPLRIAAVVLSVTVVAISGVRSVELVTNRYYLSAGEISTFGGGLSWWYPQAAMQFVRHEHLPANVFTPYNLGGFALWQLGPEYSDYGDGRLIPFLPDIVARQQTLLTMPPDSSVWMQEAQARDINTIVVPLSRYMGLGTFPLSAYCQSQNWRPVYMDNTALVMVRITPATANFTTQHAIDCGAISLAPAAADVASSARKFNFYANRAAILYMLGRDNEAFTDLDVANRIFPGDGHLHVIRAHILLAEGHVADAEKEYRAALRFDRSEAAWYGLATVYMRERRYDEAVDALKHSARVSYHPALRYRDVGRMYLAMQKPDKALKAFNQAASAWSGSNPDAAAIFTADLATNRARAYHMSGNDLEAIQYQRRATELEPRNAAYWTALADLYSAAGDHEQEQSARTQAQAVASPMPGQSSGR